MEKLSTLLEINPNDTISFKKIANLIQKHDGKYSHDIALFSSPGCVVSSYEEDVIFDVSDEESSEIYSLAFNKLLEEANNGNASSMYRIASFFQCGFPPVGVDIKLCIEWLTRSFEAGFLFSANDLYSCYAMSDSEFYDREKAEYFLSVLEENPSIRVIALYPEEIAQFETENGSILGDPYKLHNEGLAE